MRAQNQQLSVEQASTYDSLLQSKGKEKNKRKKKHRERVGFVFGNIRINWYSQSLQAIRLKQTCDQEVATCFLS